MKKWDIHYLATMKLNNKKIQESISRIMKSFISEADEEAEKPSKADKPEKQDKAEKDAEENPFAAGGGDESEDAPKDAPAEEDGGDDESDDDKEEKKPAQSEKPAGVPIKFDISGVKKYNKAGFTSDKGIVKSISKKGVIVTTEPDGVDVLVNFDDISESVNRFFKKKK